MEKVQLNKYAIELFKRAFISNGFSIEESPQPIGEVNFLAFSKSNKTLKIKVRSVTRIGGYIFIEKSKFNTSDPSLYMAVIYKPENKSEQLLYLVPAVNWKKNIYPFSGKDYNKPGQKSSPEWGICYSEKAKDAMEPYRFNIIIKSIS